MSLFPEITDPGELELPIALVPYEDVRVWATSARHAGLSAKITVNRVRYDVRFDLHLEDGSWVVNRDGLIMSRVTYKTWSDREPSWAARRKVLDKLTPWFVELLESDAGRELLRAAELGDVRLEREKLERDLAELDEKRAALTARLEAVSS